MNYLHAVEKIYLIIGYRGISWILKFISKCNNGGMSWKVCTISKTVVFDHNGSKGNYAKISSREVTSTNQKPPASYVTPSALLRTSSRRDFLSRYRIPMADTEYYLI